MLLAIDVDPPFRGALALPFVGEEWPFWELESPLSCFGECAVTFEECREPFVVDGSASRRIALLLNLLRLREGGPPCEILELLTPPDTGDSGADWRPKRTSVSALGFSGSPLVCVLSSDGLRRRLRAVARKLELGGLARFPSPTAVEDVPDSSREADC